MDRNVLVGKMLLKGGAKKLNLNQDVGDGTWGGALVGVLVSDGSCLGFS